MGSQKESSHTSSVGADFENARLVGYDQVQDNLLYATIRLQQIKS